MFSFASIAGKIVVPESLLRFFGEPMGGLAVGTERRRRIASASTGISSRHSRSGGISQLDDRQAVIQILPKFARFDAGGEILVRSADDAHVDRSSEVAPTLRTVFSWIARSSLTASRAAGRRLRRGTGWPVLAAWEKSVAVAFGTCKSALSCSKELTLHQVSGIAPQLTGTKASLAPRPLAVDETGGELFSAPGLACEVDWRLAACELLDLRAHLLDPGA